MRPTKDLQTRSIQAVDNLSHKQNKISKHFCLIKRVMLIVEWPSKNVWHTDGQIHRAASLLYTGTNCQKKMLIGLTIAIIHML